MFMCQCLYFFDFNVPGRCSLGDATEVSGLCECVFWTLKPLFSLLLTLFLLLMVVSYIVKG